MASGFEESTSRQPPSPTFATNRNNNSERDSANFECNICFELAQDPIVTLCGHLFCWPCLYRWLHIHSLSQECPVCKALVEEQKLVPLYGRGKNSSDPRNKSIPGLEIPHRPAGQRPETAPAPNSNANPNPFAHQQDFGGFMGGFGPFGGFAPVHTARFGNFTLSTAIGGLFPSFFNLNVNGFSNAGLYGHGAGFHYGGHANPFHGGPANSHGFPQHGNHGHHHQHQQQNQADSTLKLLFLVIGISVLLTLLWN